MTTQIFDSYSAFAARKDKSVNGVSKEFAERHPDYAEQNDTNTGCWNCSHCSGCSDCSRCSGCSDCSYCSHCSRCSGCSDCSRCSGCSYCSRCSYCSGCSHCSDCSRCSRCSGKQDDKNTNGMPLIPVIPDLDKAVYAAASQPESLAMDSWHTCEQTHCRAGWIVTLAGTEGKALENYFDTPLAAMLIYEKSTGRKISPVRFFETNETALADMKQLAEV